MKRILVIDESEVVRETLALILGSEFAVVKRPPASRELPFSDLHEEVDLLIFGVAPPLTSEGAGLLKFAAQLPFAVLFLVDSKTTARAIPDREQIACLTKPFNPYDLQEKVGQLLARHNRWTSLGKLALKGPEQTLSRYLEYPFISRSAAILAQKFATTHFPVLISGEIGCGQSRIAQAMHKAQKNPGSRFVLSATDISTSALEQKGLEIAAVSGKAIMINTLVIENLDKASAQAQSLLLSFLEQEEERFVDLRFLSTSGADLLERVYRGEFLDTLYYKLATLTLKLTALRDRRDDIPTLADWFAGICAKNLNLTSCIVANDAKARLSDYLWFGNVSEMETVIARTLALHRKARIDAADLVFDFGADVQLSNEETSEFAVFIPHETPAENGLIQPVHPARQVTAVNGSGHGKLPDLNVVIHELAHELKNPMVTIKTFAQLLGDRYEDENFRARFQEVVGNDIERMDDLLEVMIEFADFSQPRRDTVVLEEKLRSAIKDVSNECVKRQTRVQWKGNGVKVNVQTDEAQLAYILKNVLLAILMQTRVGSEIEIEVEQPGSVAVSYSREGARVASIAHYLTGTSGNPNESMLPLRILLAKQLVERNGGRMMVEQADSDKETVRMEFPIGEYGKEK
jgi:two-component system NtrC family response regulator